MITALGKCRSICLVQSVAYDIRGLGDSSVGDGQFTMESFVDDLGAVIDDINFRHLFY